ncbi:putative hydro-lyase [Helianthus anomalus]
MWGVITFFFLNGKFWITDGPLEYHRVTSGTTRSCIYTNSGGNPINMGKPSIVGIEPRTYWSQSLISPQDTTRL